MADKKALYWKIPVGVVGGLLGLVLLLLIVVASVLYVPGIRKKAVAKGVSVAEEKMDLEIEIGDIYLSPFHHSPVKLLRAGIEKQTCRLRYASTAYSSDIKAKTRLLA